MDVLTPVRMVDVLALVRTMDVLALFRTVDVLALFRTVDVLALHIQKSQAPPFDQSSSVTKDMLQTLTL